MRNALVIVAFVSVFNGCIACLAADEPVANEEVRTRPISVQVAAISYVPVKFDLSGNADRLERAFREAKAGGAQLAVGPEGALDGYVINEILAGDVPEKRISEVAISTSHAAMERFQSLARELEMCLVFGFAERIGKDVFNCAVFIDNKGEIRGKQHKMQFAEGYHPSWWFNRLGEHSRAFDTPFGRCGVLICNDRWNPRIARLLVMDGAQFILIPAWGTATKVNDKAVLRRAKENGVPIVEANVGVTLVIDEGRIAAVDRKEEGITFGTITIPPDIKRMPGRRDKLEQEFLVWRQVEMEKRYHILVKRIQREHNEE